MMGRNKIQEARNKKDTKIKSQFGICFLIIFCILSLVPCSLAVDGTSFDPSAKLYNARQIGLGGANLGFTSDANNVFSNPAGLTKIEFPKASVTSRTLLLGEVQYSLMTWAFPTNLGTFGLGYTGVGASGSFPTKLDPATNRVIIDPSREATSYSNSVLSLSYAKQFKENLAIGTNLKLFNQSLSGDTSSRASATGLDLSFLFTPNPSMNIGASIQNLLEPNLNWQGGASDKIGRRYKLGAKIQREPYVVGLDYDTGSSYSLGVEYPLVKNIALRAGYNPSGLAFGVGLTNDGFRFDYAYHQNSDIPGEMPHYFTLSYVGERVLKIKHKLKKKIPYIRFISPQDRLLTTEPMVWISAEATAGRVLEKRKIWEVTAVSATQEISEVIDPEPLKKVFFNGSELNHTGTISVSSRLVMGHNVMQVHGYTDKEVEKGTLIASAEIRVLRYKPFDDVPPDYWALRPIMLCETLQLIKGYPDNTFRPNKGITRAELITLLVRTMPIDEDELFMVADFKDVKADHWANKYIAYGVENGLATGYPNGTFKPNKVLSRAEAVTILTRYAKLSTEAEVIRVPHFTDLKENYWANKYILAADNAGLLKYLENKDFEPSKPFSRAEACEVLYQTPAVQELINHFWETGEKSFSRPAPAPTTEATTTETFSTVETTSITTTESN